MFVCFSDSTSKWNHTVFIFFWLILLSIISLRSIHAVKMARFRFLWLSNTPLWGFPNSTSGKEPACHCRRRKRCGFGPWVGRIPWRRAWQTHSGILAWRIPWTEKPGRLQVHKVTQSRTWLKQLSRHTVFHCISLPRILYPLIYWCALRLLPYLGYCKYCCNEHKGYIVLF